MIARRLMIVEDEMLVQLHLERVVIEMGHEVTAKASTARQAIEEASQVAPELVLMDINLPGSRDGISAAKELRERYGCAVVFATAHADEATLMRAEAVAPAGYLVKPFTSTEVRAAVQMALARTPVKPAPRRSVRASPKHLEPFGTGTRMLVYSHDSFGMGHLQRSLKLIRAVIKRNPGTSILLVTGSPAVHRYELPEGADYVKLPSVRKIGPEAYTSRSLAMSGEGVRNLRSNLLLHIVRDYDPNVVLVDHSPAGMQGEFVPALHWLSERTGCRRILGLRDVTDDAANVRELWSKQGIYDLMQRHYDDIIVYGDRDFYDPVLEYRLQAAIGKKVQYVGFVCEAALAPSEDLRVGARKPRVAVSIGGGDGAVSMIFDYLEMIRRFGAQLDIETEILTGPLIAADDLRQVRERAEGLPVVIHEFMASTSRFFAEADLVVCTAGYNTVTQLLRHAKRALLIPRVLHRREQLVRSRRLEALGLVRCLHPTDCSPGRLFSEIRAALAEPVHRLVEARQQELLPLDGAERFAEFCSGLMVETSSKTVGE